MATLITIIASYLAIAINSTLLKFLTVLFWLMASVKLRIKRVYGIKLKYLFSALILLSLIKTALAASSLVDFFRIFLVDGLYYYYLAVFITGNESLNRLSKEQIIFSGIFIFLIISLRFKGTNVGYAYGIIEYLLIPAIFFLRRRRPLTMFLIIIGFMLALWVNSRSYVLFFTLNTLLLIYTAAKRRLLMIIMFVFIAFLIYHGGYMDGIIDKFASKGKNSLIAGDSRLFLLADAFGNMTLYTFLFGNGFLATYSSFVERSTIEIGFLQDAFYFGFPFALWYMGTALKKAIRYKRIDFFITGFIFIHLVDYLIYCHPTASFYRLLCIILIFSNVKEIDKAPVA